MNFNRDYELPETIKQSHAIPASTLSSEPPKYTR
jgi:hypothetical protein